MASASGGKTTYGVYAYVEYSVSSNDTTTTLTVTKAQVKTSTASVGIDGQAGTFSGTGQTTKTNNSWKMRNSATVNVFSQFSWSWTRGTSAETKSISFYIKFDGHSSTASFTVSVPARSSWTVGYNANGGTGSIGNQTKYYGYNITLSNGAGFSRTHYTLLRWNTNSAGTGTNYNLSGTYSTNAGATMYAVWKLNAVKVYAKVSGVWKQCVVYTKVNGAWKIPYVGYTKVSGTWKQIK